jgi:Heterokaryon incompatibility protein (HET)
MWLLNTSTLVLNDFVGANIPPYAILSHTWGPADEEVSFRDLRKERATTEGKAGYNKVQNCCLKAAQEGYQYLWIDTCCIDKRSSAELSEAINSMYKWYQNAQVCYVYLVDVPGSGPGPSPEVNYDALSKSRWFTRGWTLQELIAPSYTQFFGQDWSLIGTKGCPRDFLQDPSENKPSNARFLLKLAQITGIKETVLRVPLEIRQMSLAQRMSWAARRQTTREEDIAYALMGLFGVNMPILYGEGQRKAFERLQLEIIKSSPDQSIFAWRADRESSGLLAESPLDFADSGAIHPWNRAKRATTILPYAMTNMGLSINLPLRNISSTETEELVLAALRCWVLVDRKYRRVQIYLRSIHRKSPTDTERPIYRRERCDTLEVPTEIFDKKPPRFDIYVLEDEQFNNIELIDSFEPRR